MTANSTSAAFNWVLCAGCCVRHSTCIISYTAQKSLWNKKHHHPILPRWNLRLRGIQELAHGPKARKCKWLSQIWALACPSKARPNSVSRATGVEKRKHPVVTVSERRTLPFYTFIVQTRGTHSNSGKTLSCTIFKNEQISLFQVTITLEIQETNKIRLSKRRTYELFYHYYSSYSTFPQVPYFSHLHASAEYSLPSAHSTFQYSSRSTCSLSLTTFFFTKVEAT